MVISAVQGYYDDMLEHDKKSRKAVLDKDGNPKAKTSHSLNPVPCVIYDPECKGEYERSLVEGLGISSSTATCLNLLGFVPPADYDRSVLSMKA